MPASYDYAERLCARLPRVLQELREAAGLSRYALEKKCGVSRERIGCIESGDSIPAFRRNALRQVFLYRGSPFGFHVVLAPVP